MEEKIVSFNLSVFVYLNSLFDSYTNFEVELYILPEQIIRVSLPSEAL